MTANYQDWHPADIISALKKKGTSLAAVSRNAGLSSSTLSNALMRPWPKGEHIIAKAIGVEPQHIWPSRYYDPITHQLRDRHPRAKRKTKKSTDLSINNKNKI